MQNNKLDNKSDNQKNIVIRGEYIKMIQVSENEYSTLYADNERLRHALFILESNHNLLKEEMKTRELTIEELRKENEELKKEIYVLKQNITELINKNKYNEALAKLHDCDALANKTFKQEYKKYWKLNKYDPVPNIGDIVNDPPIKEDKDYEFWQFFCDKYKNSNKIEFQKIYKLINNNRVSSGAHFDVSNIKENEFIELLKIAIPAFYNENINLCYEYKNWLFLF
jgi:hypothetical protein